MPSDTSSQASDARPHIIVVGGGLAGLSAALCAADTGMRVTLLERRHRLGGATWSFERNGIWYDNGQHVFMRCFESYLWFLERIGSAHKVFLQSRLDVPVLRVESPTSAAISKSSAIPTSSENPASPDDPAIPAAPASVIKGSIRRTASPAPLHLMRSLLHYPHMTGRERINAARTALALRKLDPDKRLLDSKTAAVLRSEAKTEPRETNAALQIDDVTFGQWLRSRGESENAIRSLWNLITLPTANLPADQVSLQLAAKIFVTGLLTDNSAADIGWSAVPLSELHADAAAATLRNLGAEVRTKAAVEKITINPLGVRCDGEHLLADAVVAAVPHTAADILPEGSIKHQDRLSELGESPIINVHLVYDRPMTDLPLAAALGSEAQFVFDRTAAAKLNSSSGESSNAGKARNSDEDSNSGEGRQCLGISLSAADEYLSWSPAELIEHMTAEVAKLFPKARGQQPRDAMVTREVSATFRGVPGTASLRPPAETNHAGLFIAGAWTDTGWPATMEGAVRSGIKAADLALRYVGAADEVGLAEGIAGS